MIRSFCPLPNCTGRSAKDPKRAGERAAAWYFPEEFFACP